MKKVEVLCDEVNGVVVQVEGRSFPGLVLQGDQLFVLVSLAANLEPHHHTLQRMINDYYEWYMAHTGQPVFMRIRKSLIIHLLKEKFKSAGGRATIPYMKPKNNKAGFEAECTVSGINVDNLRSEPFLPWSVFTKTIEFLQEKNGRAMKGNGTQGRLGEKGVPLDSIEGIIASNVYGKRIGDSVFRRITPIACILHWAGMCENKRGELILNEHKFFPGLEE